MSSVLLWACALLLVPVGGQQTTCSTSVNGRYGLVTCHFGLDVNKTKYGFRLELQPEDEPDNEPVYALVCLWDHELLRCRTHIGFIFDNQQVSESLTLQISSPASYEGLYLCRLVPAYGETRNCIFKIPVTTTTSPPLLTTMPDPAQTTAATCACSTDVQDGQHTATSCGGDSSITSLKAAVITLSLLLILLLLILCICGFSLRRRKNEKPWKCQVLNNFMSYILRWTGLEYTNNATTNFTNTTLNTAVEDETPNERLLNTKADNGIIALPSLPDSVNQSSTETRKG